MMVQCTQCGAENEPNTGNTPWPVQVQLRTNGEPLLTINSLTFVSGAQYEGLGTGPYPQPPAALWCNMDCFFAWIMSRLVESV